VGARVRLGDIVGAFKSLATTGYIAGVKAKGWLEFRGRLWQRNYYEHIIRDEDALNRIRRYVDDNPARWELDDENPRKALS
jgi:REP element-mobilizing transposase RayT